MNGNLNGKPNSHMYNGIVSDVESDCKIDNRDLYGSVNSRATFPHRSASRQTKNTGRRNPQVTAKLFGTNVKKIFLIMLEKVLFRSRYIIGILNGH